MLVKAASTGYVAEKLAVGDLAPLKSIAWPSFQRSVIMFRFSTAVVALVVWSWCQPTRGDILIVSSNVPQPDENVLFNEAGLITTGNPVQGITNMSAMIVEFAGVEDLTTPAAGQARIQAVEGTYDDLLVDLASPDATFTSLIFNLNAAEDGQATIRVFEEDATATAASFDIDANGENFFTITAINNQRIASVEITTTSPLDDVRQFRIGGVVVPEPTSLVLLLCSLVGVMCRRFSGIRAV
jgi:hypothetical protein